MEFSPLFLLMLAAGHDRPEAHGGIMGMEVYRRVQDAKSHRVRAELADLRAAQVYRWWWR